MFFSSLITPAPSKRERITPRGNHYPEFSINNFFGFYTYIVLPYMRVSSNNRCQFFNHYDIIRYIDF